MPEGPSISVVCPLYNEEGNVTDLVSRVTAIMEAQPGRPSYEVVLVNDGSRDRTLEIARSLARRDAHVVIVNLSRNFGHQIAATAGLDIARGDAVVLMDGDLQDPPELIGAFLERWREGYDVVYAVRRSRRGESAFKVLTAKWFYRITRRLTNVSIPVDAGDFRLMSRRVVDALGQTREKHRFLRGLVSWVGYRQIGIEYDRDRRLSGKTKYPIGKMLGFALDGITSFSEIPLRFATYFGFFVSVFAFVYALVVIGLKIAHRNTPGYTSTMVAILFLGGVQLITVGILGEYVGRIYDQVKARPLYFVDSIESASSSYTAGASALGSAPISYAAATARSETSSPP
ncbi:MAG: glycosyltransferase family 2 protein [Candidatus Eremiobacteraeota bacterium]|nr:glycosyltransferase family 2 protein [Candidatus Eremiobacteraeota bacterium]